MFLISKQTVLRVFEEKSRSERRTGKTKGELKKEGEHGPIGERVGEQVRFASGVTRTPEERASGGD